jgi:outer membrane lipoprotein SlyB
MKLTSLVRPLCAALAVAVAGALGGCVVYPDNGYYSQGYQPRSYYGGSYVTTPQTYPVQVPGSPNYNPNAYYGQYGTYDGYGARYPQQPQPYYGQAYQGQAYQAPCSPGGFNAGTLIGGAAGGLLGSTIGRGKGQLAAVAGGALLGGMAGTSVANGGYPPCR